MSLLENCVQHRSHSPPWPAESCGGQSKCWGKEGGHECGTAYCDNSSKSSASRAKRGVYRVNSSQVRDAPQKRSGYITRQMGTFFKEKSQTRGLIIRMIKTDSFLIISFISYKNIAQKSRYTETEFDWSIAASKPISTWATCLLQIKQEVCLCSLRLPTSFWRIYPLLTHSTGVQWTLGDF